jgi:hypothetical protein
VTSQLSQYRVSPSPFGSLKAMWGGDRLSALSKRRRMDVLYLRLCIFARSCSSDSHTVCTYLSSLILGPCSLTPLSLPAHEPPSSCSCFRHLSCAYRSFCRSSPLFLIWLGLQRLVRSASLELLARGKLKRSTSSPSSCTIP